MEPQRGREGSPVSERKDQGNSQSTEGEREEVSSTILPRANGGKKETEKPVHLISQEKKGMKTRLYISGLQIRA